MVSAAVNCHFPAVLELETPENVALFTAGAASKIAICWLTSDSLDAITVRDTRLLEEKLRFV